jgi:hypothetical protein
MPPSQRSAVQPVKRVGQAAWDTLPGWAKEAAKKPVAAYGRLTSESRPLPEYLIVGAQRSGTSSLYHYLTGHPAVVRALTKEIRFFDVNYANGTSWYRSHFPSARYRAAVKQRSGLEVVTGEASPDYLFHPLVPDRVAPLLPAAKVIVVLRNPVDRAHSHYWHQVRRGFEPLSFDDAIDREADRLRGEFERVVEDPAYVSFERHHHSYLARGIYVEQIGWWLRRFPREQLMVIRSEDLFTDAGSVAKRLLEFLGLPPRDLGRFPQDNAFSQAGMDAATRARLVEYFRPHNDRLSELLQRDFRWDR